MCCGCSSPIFSRIGSVAERRKRVAQISHIVSEVDAVDAGAVELLCDDRPVRDATGGPPKAKPKTT
eukprot:scaffold64591_cov30-Tisochrysis_lutea.AAC.4